jgi:hypothetical protein
MTELGYVYESKDGRLWSYRECAEAADRGASGAETRALNDLLCAQERLAKARGGTVISSHKHGSE